MNDVDAIFNQARQTQPVGGPVENLPPSSSRSFTGTARRLTGETVPSAPQRPEVVTHNITFWSNGFTVDDGPLRRLDDPENAHFLEVISIISEILIRFTVSFPHPMCYANTFAFSPFPS